MPILDRLQSFDERSRNYPIRTMLDQEAPIRSFTWRTAPPLDQGSEGACVGFSWAQELAARPFPVATTNEDALNLYRTARQLDAWEGEDYSGTSVIAGAKAVQARGFMAEYRWAFGLEDLVRTLAYMGPAVLGINWWTGMFRPESDGRIRPTGQVEGGHAILAHRVTGPRYRAKAMRRRVWLYNSWGASDGWPLAWMSWDDMEKVLLDDGEACIPVRRR